MSSLSEFFDNKSVLLTGSTGFVGKCLLEKLLRSFPTIKAIYCILRPKSGNSVKNRLNSLLSEPIFSTINSNQLKKVIVISGDVTYDEIGLNPFDRQTILDEIEIVFNCAATIRFDEPLRRAIQLNVYSVQRLLRLVQRFSRLECLVHVSTAYCTKDKNDVTEEILKEKVSPQKLLDAIEWMDDVILNQISSVLLKGRQTTYHLSKSLSEQLLQEEGKDIPLAIIRPSIIGCAIEEPSRGWIDNYNGLTGYLVANGKGILRTLHCKPDLLCDVIPVDIVVNTCIASARSVASGRHESPLVVNCVSGALNGITWRQINEISIPLLKQYPSIELFRVPSVALHSSSLIHYCHLVLEHSIPSFIVDILFRASGLTPILGKVYQKVNRSMAALEYFTCNEWKFTSNHMIELNSELSLADNQEFNCDVTRINWNQYFEDYILGIRKYLLKEKFENIDLARKQLNNLKAEIKNKKGLKEKIFV